MVGELKEEKEGSWFLRHKFTASMLSFFLIVLIILLFFGIFINAKPKTCGDSTLYDSCSTIKPYYCDAGSLVEKASSCGCSNPSKINGSYCYSDLKTEPEKLSLKYILNGEEKSLEFYIEYKTLI